MAPALGKLKTQSLISTGAAGTRELRLRTPAGRQSWALPLMEAEVSRSPWRLGRVLKVGDREKCPSSQIDSQP